MKTGAISLVSLMIIFSGGCAKVYVQIPSGSQYRAPEERPVYQERNQEPDQRQSHPLFIRQGIKKMASECGLDPENFEFAYEQALKLSQEEKVSAYRNLRVKILLNDGSIDRITKKFNRVCGWLLETRIDRREIAIFIPQDRNFVLGIEMREENDFRSENSNSDKSNPQRESAAQPPIIPMREKNDNDFRDEETVAPVSDEEAQRYYQREGGRK